MAEWLRNIALTEPESKNEMTELIDRVTHRAGHQSVNLEDVTKPTTNVIVKQRSATYPHSRKKRRRMNFSELIFSIKNKDIVVEIDRTRTIILYTIIYS